MDSGKIRQRRTINEHFPPGSVVFSFLTNTTGLHHLGGQGRVFLWKVCAMHSHKLSILQLFHSLIGVDATTTLISKISWEQRGFSGGEQSGKAKKAPVVEKIFKAALRFDIDNLFSIQNLESVGDSDILIPLGREQNGL